MKRIIITGGSGMIGSNLTEALLNHGHSVTCIDNFYSGQRRNIAAFLKYSNYTLIEQDVRIPFELDADEIYHLAAPASPKAYQRDSLFTLRTILLGTENALKCAYKNNARILVASTSEVYGQPLHHPQNEDYWGNVNTTGIRACYDEGKRCSETFCAEFHRHYNINAKIARIFNTYGPNMLVDDGRVVSEFIVHMLKNEPLYVHGDGTQTRSFCYVADTVRGLIKLMASDETAPVNIGNPLEIQINELLNCIEISMMKKAIIRYRELPTDDPLRRRPDIRKATERLNWKPEVSLEEGIKNTIAYFRSVLV